MRGDDDEHPANNRAGKAIRNRPVVWVSTGTYRVV
jgi:hypothetical protein